MRRARSVGTAKATSLALVGTLLLAASTAAAGPEGEGNGSDLSQRPRQSSVAGDMLGGIGPGIEVDALAELADHPRNVALAAAELGLRQQILPSGQVVLSGRGPALRALLATGAVTRLETILEPSPAGLVTEGLGLIGADAWHAGGYRGSGVKVAVVDTGFDGYEALLGADLPASVTVKSFRLDGRIDLGYQNQPDGHGTAVAEIIHDIAPDADLYLVNFNTSRFGEVVDYLIDHEVDVVNSSISYLEGPFDGSSPVALEVARAVEAGITWVTAAGNQAERHWGGVFEDTDNDGWGQVQGVIELNDFGVAPGSQFSVSVTWSGSSDADLDVCLLGHADTSPVLLTCSYMLQGPGDRPADWLIWQQSPADGRYGYAVWHVGGQVSRFDVHLSKGVQGLRFVVAERSLTVPGDVEEAITVGAVAWWTPEVIEPYSGRGPTVDGRIKPDVVGPTGITTFSLSPFFGTSASSPHIAGLAALYQQARPLAPPQMTKEFIESRAVPIPGTSPKDNTFGWGRGHVGATLDPDLISAPIVVLGGSGVVSDSVLSQLTSCTESPVTRLAGSNRYATAAAISSSTFTRGVPVAYLATGENFPDALAGGPVAALNGGPILLTRGATLPAETLSELNRLEPQSIVILGGSAVVSPSVEKQLRGLTSGTVTRLAGTDRFSTAAAISDSTFGEGVPVAYVAIGTDFPDALAGGPLGAFNGGPILLVIPNDIPSATVSELQRLKPLSIIVLGGTGVISSGVEKGLKNFTSGTVTRIAGSNRFGTAAAASSTLSNVSTVYVATGFDFPDALAGSAVAGGRGPILLVTSDAIPSETLQEINRLEPGTCSP